MRNAYENPLCVRYASKEMKYIFSDDNKFSTWRKLWIALAKAEKALGIDITEAQIAEMEAAVYDIDYEKAAEYEHQLRHDVMAHVHTFGDLCPNLFLTEKHLKDIIIQRLSPNYLYASKVLISIHMAFSAFFAAQRSDTPKPATAMTPSESESTGIIDLSAIGISASENSFFSVLVHPRPRSRMLSPGCRDATNIIPRIKPY